MTLSPNAERFLRQNEDKSSSVFLHFPYVRCCINQKTNFIYFIRRSNRLALVIDNNIGIISINTSEVLLEIPLNIARSNQYNHLNCLAWSNNGKLLAYGHWSDIFDVYSSNDGQLLHELPTKSVLTIFRKRIFAFDNF